MIIDAHCHAWEHWPYQPAVPDPLVRSCAERLLWEMDQAGVVKAVLIAAQIDHNPGNNAYTADRARGSGGRLLAFPGVDCRWDATHHTPGAADRLRAVAKQFNPVGFTHYLHEDHNPSWLLSSDGLAFFAAADALRLIVSLACGPSQLPTLCALARHFPRTPFMIHHLGRVKAEPFDQEGLQVLLQCASVPNLYVKLSGFGYAVRDGWDYPCRPALSVVQAVYDNFGPARLCWGSDYPISQRYMTYRQTLEVVRTYCRFIPEPDMQQVLGGTFQALVDSHVGHPPGPHS